MSTLVFEDVASGVGVRVPVDPLLLARLARETSGKGIPVRESNDTLRFLLADTRKEDRRRFNSGPPSGVSERRNGRDRRKLQA